MSNPQIFNNVANDRISESVRTTERLFSGNGGSGGPTGAVIFAEITEIRDDTDEKQAAGKELYYDSVTWEKIETPDGKIFDIEESPSARRTGDIYSDTAMEVGDVVEVFRYRDKFLKSDQSEAMQWLVRTGGGAGAERPVIMAAGTEFTFGAIITSPTDLTPIREFTAEEGITFKSILPWGASVAVPDDFIFVGDLNLTTYFTESYPKTLWAKPTAAYPVSGGITSFKILDSRSSIANILLSSSGEQLILQDFDNAGSSPTERTYFTNKYFACSYDHNDSNFYLNHPLF